MNSTFNSSNSSQSHLTFKQEKVYRNVKKSTQTFTTDFHKYVADEFHNTNFVSSSLSAQMVLAMAAYGAYGRNKAEMKRALHLPDSDEAAYQEFEAFNDTLNNVQNVTLKIANKIYTSNTFEIKERYKEISGTHFRSECTTLNFSNSNEVANTVNQWCFEKTNGKISDIIGPGDVGCNSRMILLNAIYFKGDWEYEFSEEATEPKTFYTSNASKLDVPTMHIQKKFFYKNLTEVDARVIAIPYKNPELTMFIILPNQVDGLRQLEENLDKVEIDYDRFEYEFDKTEVDLALPKFRIECTIALNGILQRLGMTQMFLNEHNFCGISDKPLKVDKVIQKAFIEVNEEGSEAAAVTAMEMLYVRCARPKPRPINFTVDRPFLYKIVWKGVPLFSGHVYNPIH